MAKDSTQDLWPRWPAGYEHPLSLVDIRVKLDVDRLFHLLYAPGSEYVARSQEGRGNKDYVETPWVSDMAELAEAELAPPPPHSKAAQMDVRSFESRLRKTSCSSFGMGLKFKAEEVQRCVKGVKGKYFEVEVCVATTATYGDKFRGVCRHRFKAEDYEWSTWKAEFALVYVQPVNGLLKRAIERGSAGGLAKNFATLVEILGTFAEVKDPQKEVHLQTSRASSSQAAGLPASDARLGGLLNASLVQTFDSLAISLGLSAGRGSMLATGMAVAVLLLVLEGVLDSSGWVLGLFSLSPVQLSIPANIMTMITSLLLFKIAQVAIVYAVAGVRQGSESVRRHWGASRAISSTTGDGESDIPTAGTRFDGFNAALENASADIASAEHSLRQAASHSSALLSPHSSARMQLRSGVKGLQKLVTDTWTAGRKAVTSGALSPERAVSPPRPQRPSPSPPAQVDSGDEAGLLSDDASPGGSARMSKRTSRRIARSRSPTKETESALQARAVELSALGPKALSFTSQTSSQQSAEERGVVEAEVFENERFLPFRGWGHEWPGHLLPTDRVGHWSLRGDRPSGAESMDFHRVAPALPQGWQWLDEDWHIDMTGHEDACVDNEGWYYAVDFNWLKHPPGPGSGRFKRVRDYVRRRRWVRTRVRDDNAALASSTLHQLSTMSSLPPPLLPLAELLGDSVEVLPSDAVPDRKLSDQQGAGSFSKRASGSGEHKEPSRAASISLDFGSGKAGSQLPTPRLMYSTSRGLSLQESGVELCDMPVRLQLDVSEESERPISLSIVNRQDAPPADSIASQAADRLSTAVQPRDSAHGILAAGEDHLATQTAALPRPAVARHTPATHQPPQPAQEPVQGSAFAEVAAAGDDCPETDASRSLRSQEGCVVTSGPAVQQHASEQHSESAEAVGTADASHSTSPVGVQARAQLVEQEVRASLEPSTSVDSSPAAARSSKAAARPSHESRPPALQQAPAAMASDPDAQHSPSHSDAPAGTTATSNEDKADAGPIVKPTLKGLNVGKPPAGGSKPPSTAVSPNASGMQHAADPDQAAVHGGALSDQEALSPGALSDSSEFGGRAQQGSGRDGHSHAGHVDWNEFGKRSSRLAALAGEGLRKGLRDMQQHATRQAAGKREPEESGGPESAAASHPDMEHNLKRPDMTQRDPGGNTFLQSLKARGEQSLSAARSALSPETGKQHEGQLEKTPSQGKDGQPSIGPSVRGMFSDLKRTMERVGASPLIQGASTLGRRESSSSLREGLEHALADSVAEKQLQDQFGHAGMPSQHLPESVPAVGAMHSIDDKCKSISDSHSRRSSEGGDGTPEVLSADEWGDFDFDHA